MTPSPELVERLWADGYRIARSIVRDHATAEDAVQEACVRLHLWADRLRDEALIDRWFFRVVVRECYARLRQRKRHVALADAHVPPVAPASTDRVDLQTAIAALPDKQRLAVIFRYHYGFSDADVATILRTSHAAVRMRLFKARASLRSALDAGARNAPRRCS